MLFFFVFLVMVAREMFVLAFIIFGFLLGWGLVLRFRFRFGLVFFTRFGVSFMFVVS